MSHKQSQYKISFQSKALVNYKEIDQKEIFLFPKIAFLSLVQIVLGAWMIAFICVGFQANYQSYSIQQLPEWVATFRSISLFLILWYVAVSCFLLHHGIQEIKFNNKLIGYNVSLSLLLIPSFLNLFFSLKNTNWNYVKKYFQFLFTDDADLKEHFSRKNWKYWMMLGVLIVMTPMLLFVFYLGPNHKGFLVIGENGTHLPEQKEYYSNFWYNSLQYFTIQTNLFCYLWVILFVIFPYKKLFKSNSYLIYAVTYLLIVGVTYDFALLPNKIVGGETANWTSYDWATTVYEHMVDPIVFCGSGIVILSQSKKFITRDYLTTLKFGLIIPTIYLTYALINPFVCNESVYGWFTNSNPNLWTNYADVDSSIPKHGEPYFCLFIIAYWLVFVGVITAFWTINQMGYLRTISKQGVTYDKN